MCHFEQKLLCNYVPKYQPLHPVRSGPVRSGPVRSGPVRSGPVRRADNFTTLMCQFSLNLGDSTSWKPQSLFRPVQEFLYFYDTLDTQHQGPYLKLNIGRTIRVKNKRMELPTSCLISSQNNHKLSSMFLREPRKSVLYPTYSSRSLHPNTPLFPAVLQPKVPITMTKPLRWM